MMAREEQRLRRSPFLVPDPELRDYLQGIACRVSGPHCPDVRVYAVRNAYFNASMAPNGMMQVWSGLLLRVDNEAQLAAVMSHEAGHYLKRHSLERLRDAKNRSALGVLLAPFGAAGLVGQLVLAATMMQYSRDQEREADAISVQLMGAAGYDTSQATLVWSNLLAEINARPNADAVKDSVLFATHPPSEERRDTLTRLGKPGGETGAERYRQTLAALQLQLLEDELKRGQYEETFALLDRKIGTEPERADYRYARGEARRLRNQPKDLDEALTDLTAATQAGQPPPQAWRSLGLLQRTRGDKAAAATSFARYLELAPNAPDASLIKSYVSELQT
ncbi:MAG TPA: M48 family metallopeptidase [Burkholderiaceae bacterium]|nr:M48 family metallopeptidase [Burkholderiaceae bacterium]